MRSALHVASLFVTLLILLANAVPVQALEAILQRHAQGEPNCVVRVNDPRGGLVLYRPGCSDPEVLYQPQV